MKKESGAILVTLAVLFGIWLGMKYNPGAQTERLQKYEELFEYIEQAYVDSVNVDSLADLGLEHILHLLDPHSTYISGLEMDRISEEMNGNFQGIGVEFTLYKDTLIFMRVLNNSPAKAAGLYAGDRVFAVEGDTMVGPQYNSDDFAARIKGPAGTSVQLSIHRQEGDTVIDVLRDYIPLESVTGVHMLNDTVGILSINRFGEQTYDEFVAAANKLLNAGMKRLVVDLRDNPGGLMNQSTFIADEFLEQGRTIVSTRYRNGDEIVTTSTRAGRLKDIPVALLMNELSASASEVLAGAIQDNDRGIIVGRQSFGKGLVQEESFLPDGSVVRLTVAYYYTPSGRSIQKPFNGGDYLQEASVDSAVFLSDSGKVLYGGGGIAPDVEVVYQPHLTRDFMNGTIYLFTFEELDQNRSKYSYVHVEDFNEGFEPDTALMNGFLRYGGYGIRLEDLGAEAKQDLAKRLKLQLGQHLFGNSEAAVLRFAEDPFIQSVLQYWAPNMDAVGLYGRE